MTRDDVEIGMARLREEWPAGSVVAAVMARVDARPARRRPIARLLIASGMAAGIVAILLLARPISLGAAVEGALVGAKSAHLVTIGAGPDGRAVVAEETWYRRGEGVRSESTGAVRVDDGAASWSWRADAGAAPTVVIKRRSQGFAAELGKLLAIAEILDYWDRRPEPTLDRAIGGRPCRAIVLTARPGKAIEPDLPPGAVPVDKTPTRFVVLLDDDRRLHEFAVERERAGRWSAERTVRIDYDADVPPARIVADLPPGARVVDADAALESLHPLDRALERVEVGGLILAVHEARPVEGGGLFVVSSVRGTPAHLAAHPPHRRRINSELSLLDVARQAGVGGVGQSDHRIELAAAESEGVQVVWWLIVPRRLYLMKDGKRVELGNGAIPGADAMTIADGAANVPLGAYYCNPERPMTPNSVSTWAHVPVDVGRPPATIDEVAARVRGDILIAGPGPAATLFGAGPTRDAMAILAPAAITDADYAASIRKSIAYMMTFDECTDVAMSEAEPAR